jgi:UDP-glucose 4-epimerase
MHVLVTGGAGFIGSNLVDALLAAGHRVTVIDNFSAGKHANLQKHSKLTVHELGVRDCAQIFSANEKINAVVHAASPTSVPESLKNPTKYRQEITEATRILLESAHAACVKRFVFVSTAAVYGNPANTPITETTPIAPLAPYGTEKYSAEQLVREYALARKLVAVVLRLFNAYGPRQDASSPYSGVVSLFMQCARENKPIVIHGNGNQTRDFVYVADVVQAILLALEKNVEPGLTVNIGTGKKHTINELAQAVLTVAAKQLPVQNAAQRQGDIAHSCADISKARATLGYEPKVNFEEGLQKTWEWFNANEKP